MSTPENVYCATYRYSSNDWGKVSKITINQFKKRMAGKYGNPDDQEYYVELLDKFPVLEKGKSIYANKEEDIKNRISLYNN